MLTRCPACDTTFRITPEQLKARKGKVRCGECQHVFNAIETLIEEPARVPAATPPAVLPPRPGAAEEPAAPLIQTPAAVPPAPTLAPDATPGSEPGADPVTAAATVDTPPVADAPTPAAEHPVEHAAAPEPVPPRDRQDEGRAGETAAGDGAADAGPAGFDAVPPHPPSRQWPWALGAAVGIIGLLVQAALHYRVELAVVAPSARPLLEAACEFAGCTVGLPTKVEMMTIETSDLQPHPDQAGRLTLTALLRNRAPFAQAYPHLELSLTDTADKVLARRVLTPADYLRAVPAAARGTMIDNGIPPGETPVSLPIQSGEAAAAGYRLYLFYP